MMDKTNIIELIKIFGLEIDYDRWEEAGWIRIKGKDGDPPIGENNSENIIRHSENNKQ